MPVPPGFDPPYASRVKPRPLSHWARAWNMRREPRKGSGPRPLGDLLRSFERGELTAQRGPVKPEIWQQIVGPRVADRSHPASLDASGVLLVHVPDAVWAQELSLLSGTIVSRLRALGLAVQSLRFAIRKLAPPRRGATRFERRTVAAPVELPEDLRAQIEKIEDPGLREAMAAAASRSRAEQAAKERRCARQAAKGTRTPRT